MSRILVSGIVIISSLVSGTAGAQIYAYDCRAPLPQYYQYRDDPRYYAPPPRYYDYQDQATGYARPTYDPYRAREYYPPAYQNQRIPDYSMPYPAYDIEPGAFEYPPVGLEPYGYPEAYDDYGYPSSYPREIYEKHYRTPERNYRAERTYQPPRKPRGEQFQPWVGRRVAPEPVKGATAPQGDYSPQPAMQDFGSRKVESKTSAPYNPVSVAGPEGGVDSTVRRDAPAASQNYAKEATGSGDSNRAPTVSHSQQGTRENNAPTQPGMPAQQ